MGTKPTQLASLSFLRDASRKKEMGLVIPPVLEYRAMDANELLLISRVSDFRWLHECPYKPVIYRRYWALTCVFMNFCCINVNSKKNLLGYLVQIMWKHGDMSTKSNARASLHDALQEWAHSTKSSLVVACHIVLIVKESKCGSGRSNCLLLNNVRTFFCRSNAAYLYILYGQIRSIGGGCKPTEIRVPSLTYEWCTERKLWTLWFVWDPIGSIVCFPFTGNDGYFLCFRFRHHPVTGHHLYYHSCLAVW